jgi:hypothetical protein
VTLSTRDQFHQPATGDRWWTETCWFSFDQPGPDLSATFYPLFRPNLGVCSLAVHLWDPSGAAPWEARYSKFMWHLAMPSTDLTKLELEGLRYDCLEPDRRFLVRYDDADRAHIELEYTGLRELWVASDDPRGGHTDQPCHVTGVVRLGDEEIPIDCLGMRDRTWSPRPDDRTDAGTGYTYGIGSADEQFLLLTALDGNHGTLTAGRFRGYLVRDGVPAPLTAATRDVTSRTSGMPRTLEVSITDELGRTLVASGITCNRLANHATPSSFAWMSMTEWRVEGGGVVFGEDQEVWSPDMLGARLHALDDAATAG